MPRSTTKYKSKNNRNNLNANSSYKSDKNNLSSKTKQVNVIKKDAENEKVIKKEFVAAPEIVTEEICHRKSERRRVARDIFLVFEEHPISRTRRTSKKQSKTKFGHLRVEEPGKSKVLLRDIKNEPMCYLSSNNVSVNVINSTVPGGVVPILKTTSNLIKVQSGKKSKTGKKEGTNVSGGNLDYSYKPNKNSKLLEVESRAPVDIEESSIARVNPIFLWVKQDDTRIVEVRCEDYDKRNRIKITKTSNGWRAIPRSDPNSSRVFKFYPTPLMKVKRETNIHDTNKNVFNVCNAAASIFSEKSEKIDCKLNCSNTVCNPLTTEKTKNKKKSKKARRKRDANKFSKRNNIHENGTEKLNVNSDSIKMLPFNKPNEISNKISYLEVTKKVENLGFATDFANDQEFNKNISEVVVLPNCLNSNLENSDSIMESELETKSTYQNEGEKFGFHLCPKTGLFVANNNSVNTECEEVHTTNYVNSTTNNCLDFEKSSTYRNTEHLGIGIGEEYNIETKLIEDNHESLEAKTKNLKDLLDNADLLQHCDDSANSDSELIDSLVKTSCEKNLIQSNEIISKGQLEHLQQKSLEETSDMVVRIIAEVSDPPKCLSFNEAGEIEGVNGELFQSNSFIETFDKQTSTTFTEAQNTLHSTTTAANITLASPQRHVTRDNFPDNIQMTDPNPIGVADEFPKDLSYNKREEVCPPSESRSQCAVTSSSDVIKSPIHDDASVFASSSETLKNIILEQFMKLNSLSNKQQMDPIDLGKQREKDSPHTKHTHSPQSPRPKSFIETVVIDDDDDVNTEEQPLKKRLRLNGHNVVPKSMSSHSKSNISLIDKDPDPLTQLRLLIQNTQWKVPDPILVPKDRLSAVLASPAREIPLLITTRPELRLPEAFAYPEIIQNPNILVISMAQLEAILKNEFAMEMFSCSPDLEPGKNQLPKNIQLPAQSNKQTKDFHSQTCRQRVPQSSKQTTNLLNSNNDNQIPNRIINKPLDTSSQTKKKDEPAKCSQTDSLSDFNAATMAVLNQMIWLPYFGQISQDIIKSIKNPLQLREQFLKFPPLCNSYANNSVSPENVNKSTNISGQSVTAPSLNTTLPKCSQLNNELSIFQKIVQQQMQNLIQINNFKADSAEQKNSELMDTAESCQQTVINAADLNIDSSKSCEKESQKYIASNKEETNFTSVCKNATTTLCNALEKSYNLRSSVAGRHSSDLKPYKSQRLTADGKPRLTCKSLSNLLNPQHSAVPSSNSSITYISNLASDILKNSINIPSTGCKGNQESSKGNVNSINNSPVAYQPCKLQNVGIEPPREFNKQRNVMFTSNIAPDNTTVNNEVSGLPTDTNVPLWHPLFGSNPKPSYSSPWQWTTVTATGE